MVWGHFFERVPSSQMLCNMLSSLSRASCKLQSRDPPSSQAWWWSISQAGFLCVCQTPHWFMDSAGLGSAQPPPKLSQILGWARNTRSVATAWEQLGVRTPRNVLDTGLLYAGAGEAFIKKYSLDKNPFLAAGGEGGLGILKKIMDFLFASQNKNNSFPQCFHSYADINIKIPRLFPVDFFGAQNRLFPELKHC